MTRLLNAVRWLAVVPVGLIGGFAAGTVVGTALLVAGGGWSLFGSASLFFFALLQPIVGYRLGQVVAPVRGKVSRWLMLIPYGLVGLLGLHVVMGLLRGRIAPDLVDDSSEAIYGVTLWWRLLWYYGGFVLGFGAILELKSSDSKALGRPHPASAPFDWARPSTNA